MKLDFNKEVKSNLKFKPDFNVNEGTVLCTLDKVYIRETKYKEGTDAEFAGKTVYALAMDFKSVRMNEVEPERYHTHVFNVPPSASSELDPDKIDGMIERLGDQIIHIVNEYAKTPNFLGYPKGIDFKNGIKDVEEHLEAYRVEFEKFVKFFNEGGKDGSSLIDNVEVYLKVLPDYKERKYYTIPTFVQEGFIEVVRKHKGARVPTTIGVKSPDDLKLSGAGAGKKVQDDEIEDDAPVF